MSELTPEQLAQSLADHFSPPFRAEDWEYIRDENGKITKDKNGFYAVRYFERDQMDTPDSAALITKRIWADGQSDIQTRALTYLELAEAVLAHYNLEPKT